MENKIKAPPNSKDSEMMVIGCMLTSINALNIAADALVPMDFYYLEHKTVFLCLKDFFLKDKAADVHLVAEELKRQDKLKIAGGVGYITSLAQYAGTSGYIEEYVRIVKDKATLRSMLNVGQMIEKKALDDPEDVAFALDEAQQLLFQVSQNSESKAGKLIADIFSGKVAESGQPYLKDLEERQERFQLLGPEKGGITGIRTHLIDLDKMLNGFNNSNLMILAARPAMGKTALAINIAENICFKENKPVGIFSLEMSAEQLLHRMICSQASVQSDKIKIGSLTPSEFHRIVEAVHFMEKYTFIIDDQPNLKITDLRARARRMKEVYRIEFLVIDYLQLLTGSAGKLQENRQQEISEISRMLKHLARELNIPILCLSQLSRKVEERQGFRPMMSDLRESGSIEQDADIVMFLFRQEYYNVNAHAGEAELIIAKNRHGSVGNIKLSYRKELAQFNNYISIDKFMPE